MISQSQRMNLKLHPNALVAVGSIGLRKVCELKKGISRSY